MLACVADGKILKAKRRMELAPREREVTFGRGKGAKSCQHWHRVLEDGGIE